MLEVFVQRPGRALTRHDILDAVWGSSVIVTTRSVDRCVTTLRGKVEPDPRHPTYIQTIRDVGYRFEDKLCESTCRDSLVHIVKATTYASSVWEDNPARNLRLHS